LKSGTSPTRWGMVGIDSISMKDFMSNGIVGKLSFFKDIFHLPNNEFVSFYVCSTNMEFI
jgi:hypothetical protein